MIFRVVGCPALRTWITHGHDIGIADPRWRTRLCMQKGYMEILKEEKEATSWQVPLCFKMFKPLQTLDTVRYGPCIHWFRGNYQQPFPKQWNMHTSCPTRLPISTVSQWNQWYLHIQVEPAQGIDAPPRAVRWGEAWNDMFKVQDLDEYLPYLLFETSHKKILMWFPFDS